jgi:hypothetical protein
MQAAYYHLRARTQFAIGDCISDANCAPGAGKEGRDLMTPMVCSHDLATLPAEPCFGKGSLTILLQPVGVREDGRSEPALGKASSMAHPSFATKLDEMLEVIERALSAIEQGGGEPELCSLQKLVEELLVNCMRLIERNPGIEAAAADLYAAASVLVADYTVSAQPLVRKLRLFREARLRFRQRLTMAHPSEHGTNIVWRHHELLSA